MSSPIDPRILILETSGRMGEVALACGPKIVRHRLLDETRLHARDLAPAVSAMMQEEDWKPADIQALIVNRGPGSYTGLRVGLMSAKAFAYATGCALLAVDGFQAIARQSSRDMIDVIADAQRDLVYHQRFTRSATGGEMLPATALQIVNFSTWIESLCVERWVSGPGLWRFSERLPAHVKIPDESLWDPHPPSLLEIGLSRYRAGERDDPWKLEPLYLRPSSAEEKWASKDQ